jgi:acetyl-CoA C-acetyltransferase
MPDAYLVEALRTAAGRRNGRLAGWHPADLAACLLDALVAKTGIDPSAIEDVVMGCVGQAGEQSVQIGRNAVLASSLPASVPAVTIDRQCGSSQQALHFAAQAVMSGTMDVVIAAGVESMTRVPMGSARLRDTGVSQLTPAIRARFGVEEFSQFHGAETIARKWGFTRDTLDRFACESHARAAAAADSGAFEREVVPVAVVMPEGEAVMHVRDEGIRADTIPEGLAALKPITEGGLITAGTSSQIADGASGVMVVSERALKEHGLRPLARIHGMTVTAGDPVVMLEEPLFATEKALQRAGMTIGDIDLYEVNEAFAPIPLAWAKHLDADPGRLNVNGGAIALGHPLGASGTRLMTTLVHALRARDLRYGLQTMCEGGGLANVTIVEAC